MLFYHLIKSLIAKKGKTNDVRAQNIKSHDDLLINQKIFFKAIFKEFKKNFASNKQIFKQASLILSTYAASDENSLANFQQAQSQANQYADNAKRALGNPSADVSLTKLVRTALGLI